MTNSTEAVKRHRARQAELGRKPKQFYLTKEEWRKMKEYIEHLRMEMSK
ncbi:MAG: hypothetical protein GY928_11360 [Colwellia sp.]|nr:hypothetical protein [Colwellia sp.]